MCENAVFLGASFKSLIPADVADFKKSISALYCKVQQRKMLLHNVYVKVYQNSVI